MYIMSEEGREREQEREREREKERGVHNIRSTLVQYIELGEGFTHALVFRCSLHSVVAEMTQQLQDIGHVL